MFGFLRHCSGDREYRASYKRCCQFQHLHYGAGSLVFLSYESIFLHRLMLDIGAVSQPASLSQDRLRCDARKCCRLSASATMLSDTDSLLGRFCSSFGMLLGQIKLEDDVRDQGSMAARFGQWMLKRRFAKSRRFFRELDFNFDRNVSNFIEDHLVLERETAPHEQIDIEGYVKPTAAAFGYLFSLAARISESIDSTKQDLLFEVGSGVGSAIIAFDCANDRQRDRRNGDYNPLADEQGETLAYKMCQQRLSHCDFLIDSINNSICASRRVLRSGVHRIGHVLGECVTPVAASAGCDSRPSSSTTSAFSLTHARDATEQAGSESPSNELPPDQLAMIEANSRKKETNHTCEGCDGCCNCCPNCNTAGGGCQIFECCGGGGDCGGCECCCPCDGC